MWKRIGISLSGGADSALLAYLICKNVSVTTDIHITNQIRMWKTRPWQGPVVDRVIDWFESKFDHNFIVHKNFIPPELEEPTDYLIKVCWFLILYIMVLTSVILLCILKRIGLYDNTTKTIS